MGTPVNVFMCDGLFEPLKRPRCPSTVRRSMCQNARGRFLAHTVPRVGIEVKRIFDHVRDALELWVRGVLDDGYGHSSNQS